MFKVGNLKINFKHEYFYVSEKTGEPVYEGTGRFGVTCFIYQEGVEEAISVGSVLIHKGDQPDRVIGKKYALRKALRVADVWNDNKQITCTLLFPKQKRTEIWDAFWDWVESWDKKKKVEFVGRVDTITIPPLFEQHNTYTQIQILLDTRNLPDDINQLIGSEAVITIERTSK